MIAALRSTGYPTHPQEPSRPGATPRRLPAAGNNTPGCFGAPDAAALT